MGSILGLFKEMESMEPIVVQPIKNLICQWYWMQNQQKSNLEI